MKTFFYIYLSIFAQGPIFSLSVLLNVCAFVHFIFQNNVL